MLTTISCANWCFGGVFAKYIQSYSRKDSRHW